MASSLRKFGGKTAQVLTLRKWMLLIKCILHKIESEIDYQLKQYFPPKLETLRKY